MLNKSMFSSAKQDWGTPVPLFEKLNEEFRFELDVCATHENAKCKNYYTPQDDCLKQDWGQRVCFMNPPYGREIGKFLEKALEESWKGSIVVTLLPARTDTLWWHNNCMRASEIRFLRGGFVLRVQKIQPRSPRQL
jgi:phage N-6-adenine-methyltransferase